MQRKLKKKQSIMLLEDKANKLLRRLETSTGNSGKKLQAKRKSQTVTLPLLAKVQSGLKTNRENDDDFFRARSMDAIREEEKHYYIPSGPTFSQEEKVLSQVFGEYKRKSE